MLQFFMWKWRKMGCSGIYEPLEGEPGVAQAFGRRCSFLREEFKHGEQEVCKGLSLFEGPLILIQQHLQQTPWLQLGDVLQVTCTENTFRPCTIHSLHSPAHNMDYPVKHTYMTDGATVLTKINDKTLTCYHFYNIPNKTDNDGHAA